MNHRCAGPTHMDWVLKNKLKRTRWDWIHTSTPMIKLKRFDWVTRHCAHPHSKDMRQWWISHQPPRFPRKLRSPKNGWNCQNYWALGLGTNKNTIRNYFIYDYCNANPPPPVCMTTIGNMFGLRLIMYLNLDWLWVRPVDQGNLPTALHSNSILLQKLE